jgi:hypothetical protein
MKNSKTTLKAGIIFVLMALAACNNPEDKVGGGGDESENHVKPAAGALTLEPGDGEITVKWASLPGLTEYTVYWADSEDGDAIGEITYTPDNASGGEILETTISGLENGKEYWVWVESGDWSSERKSCIPNVSPAPDPTPEPEPANTAKTWYVSPAIGSDTNDGWPDSAPVATVTAALQKVAAYKTAHPTEWNPGDSATIIILDDLPEPVTVNHDTSYPPVILKSSSNEVTLTGALTISGGNENSPEVTLTNLTLNGGGSNVVTVSDGKLVIQTGAVITGGGDGVVVNSGGAVTMTGGKVCADEDPDAFDFTKRVNGVVVNSGGTFNMNGGSVWNNDNGVRVKSGGTFHMTGGDIYHNGLGVWVETGAAFTKTSGTVYGDYDNVVNEIGEAEAEMYYNWDGSVYNPDGSRSETLLPHNNYP